MSTEHDTSGSDTASASISDVSILTESLVTESETSSILSQLSESDQDNIFKPNEEQRKREKEFLGYYECLIDNSKLPISLNIPTISISTARIDLHKVISRKTEVEEGKHLILTKIKESPYIKNTSLFVITGKGKQITKDYNGKVLNKGLSKKKSSYKEWTGTKFNEFPGWMQGVERLLDGTPVKGLGNYEVFINKAVNTDEINENTLEVLKREAKKEDDKIHKLALAGIYMKGNQRNKRNNENYYETNEYYKEAKDLCKKAAKLKSYEAKFCLGYIYSIGLAKSKDHNPNKAKKLFKRVAKKIDNKRIAGIAMRNIATLYHCEEINPPILKRFASLMRRDKLVYLRQAEKWYKKSLELGDSQSAYQLGLLYESNFYNIINENTDDNKNKAEEMFENAVNAVQFEDNLYAKAKLGRILINNKKDVKRGFEILEDAAEKGLNMGQTYLGEYYEKENNYLKAVEFYSKAATQNRGYFSHAAQYRLNKLKDDGHINDDIEDVLRYYRDECKYGYIETEEKFERIL